MSNLSILLRNPAPLLLVGLAAVCLTAATTALAEDPPPPPAPIVAGDQPTSTAPVVPDAPKLQDSHFVKRLDLDGDGVVSDAEQKVEEAREAKRDARRKAQLEAKSRGDKSSAKHKAQIEKYDVDGDGRLNKSERDASFADRVVEGRPGGKKPAKPAAK